MRRGFGYLEVLVVATIVVVLWIILQPVFYCNERGSATKLAQLSNVKQLATGAEMYRQDTGGRFMLAFGASKEGRYAWHRGMLTPSDPAGYAPELEERLFESASGWANALMPYVEEWRILDLPAYEPKLEPSHVIPRSSIEDSPTPIGVTYNGLLHGFPIEGAALPSRVPMFWSGLGRTTIANLSFSSPTLVCPELQPVPCTYVPASEGCSDNRNGATSRMMRAQDSVFVYGRGMHFAYADGHAKFIMLGAQLDWHTPARSPFAAYDEQGVPNKYWSAGCHTWLFRPDHELEEQP